MHKEREWGETRERKKTLKKKGGGGGGISTGCLKGVGFRTNLGLRGNQKKQGTMEEKDRERTGISKAG